MKNNNKKQKLNNLKIQQNLIDVISSFDWTSYEDQLNKINQLSQTQIDLTKQLEILRPFANKLGLYDAADYLKSSH